MSYSIFFWIILIKPTYLKLDFRIIIDPLYSVFYCINSRLFLSGDYTKDVVRKIAESASLDRVAQKRDSTGICFIGSRNFQDFISEVSSQSLSLSLFLHLATLERGLIDHPCLSKQRDPNTKTTPTQHSYAKCPYYMSKPIPALKKKQNAPSSYILPLSMYRATILNSMKPASYQNKSCLPGCMIKAMRLHILVKWR